MKYVSVPRNLTEQSLWALANHLFGRGALILASVFLARHLGTREFATYSYYQLTATTIAGFASMGLGVTTSLFFAEVRPEERRAHPRIGALFILLIGLAIAAAFAALGLPPKWLNAGLDLPTWALPCGIAVQTLGVASSGAVMGLGKFRANASVSAVSGTVLLAGAALAGARNSAVEGMLALIFAGSLQLVGESIVVARTLGRESLAGSIRVRWSDFRRVGSLAAPMVLISLMAISGSWLLGRVILAASGDSEFALYAIGQQWFALVLLLPGMVSRVILPELVRGRQSSAPLGDSRVLVRQGVVVAALAAVAIAAAGTVLAPWLLRAYGPSYAHQRWFVASFMVAAIFSAPSNILGNTIVAHRGQTTWLALTAVWFATLVGTGMALHWTGAWVGPAAQFTAAMILSLSAARVARARNLL